MSSLLVFILGLVVGSFLNVCIHRLPRGESVVYPASHCAGCGAKLSPFDLVPVLGYCFLRGRCRYCKAMISPRYPMVELLAGGIFVLSWFYSFGNPAYFFLQSFFGAVLLVIFFVDLERQVIPDVMTILGIAAGLLYGFLRGEILSSLSGMLLGFSLLYLISFLGKLYFKKEVMGEGDLYLAALLGAGLGWVGILVSIFLAYVLAALVSLLLLISGKVKFGQYIPFGPALAGGGLIVLFWGNKLIAWYLSCV